MSRFDSEWPKNAMRLDARSKVDQESKLLFSRSQVVAYLFLEKLRHSLHRFDFHDDPVLHEEVEPVLADLYAAKNDSNRYFAMHEHTALLQYDRERSDVD